MLNVKIGTYTGNGTLSTTRGITGIGFTPKVVFVWSADTGELNNPVFATDGAIAGIGPCMGLMGENGWISGGLQYDYFNSFDSDGFTIRCGNTNTSGYRFLNRNAVTYYYVALGGDDCYTGNYTGNGTDNRTISGPNFQPNWVFMMGGTQHSCHKFDSSGASTDTAAYTYNAANAANMIQSFVSTGFTVGTAAQVNTSSVVYYYFAIKSSATSAYQARYTGNNTDNRSITTTSFDPGVVFIKSTAARNWAWRSSDHSGDLSKYYRSSGFAANYIQSLDTGGFTIGNAADINTTSDSLDFIAFKNQAPGATDFLLLESNGAYILNEDGTQAIGLEQTV